MKKLFALAVLLLLGFYVAWPAWSGYRIAAALQGRDAALLESKIDFASVRMGLRPLVEAEVGKEMDKQASGGGLGGLLGGDLKKQFAPKLVDLVLDKVITGENVIRIASEGANVGGTVQKIIMEQMSKGGIPGMPNLPGLGGGLGGGGGLQGGLGSVLGAAGAAGAGGLKLPGGLNIPGMGGGQAQAPAPAQAPPAAPAATSNAKPSYGLSNIKSFGFSPLAYTVGVGRDPNAPRSDATIKMRFTGFDWKITDIVPNLN